MTNLILTGIIVFTILAIIEFAGCRRADKALRQNISTPKPKAEGKTSNDIPAILRRHADNDCLSVALTVPATSKPAREELAQLKAGASLWLEYTPYSGGDRVKVYSGGFMIGSIMLNDAEKTIEVMKSRQVTGSYVARNQRLSDGSYDLKLVIFYEASELDGDAITPPNMLQRAMTTPYKITVNLSDDTSIFQN